ncbi:MAG: hypothetical protein AB7P76_07130 [Candidatus Melainabacteria bacterium]
MAAIPPSLPSQSSHPAQPKKWLELAKATASAGLTGPGPEELLLAQSVDFAFSSFA